MTPASAIQPPPDQAPRRSESDRAIAGAVTIDLLGQAAGLWGGKLENLKALRAIQNFVYAADLPQGHSILRLTHDSYRSAEEVKAEVQWIDALQSAGVSVCPARQATTGKFVEVIESSHGNFIATCFIRAKGEPPDPANSMQWNEMLFEKWGAFMAAMHNAARTTSPTPRRNHWSDELIVRNYKKFVPKADVAVRESFDRLFLQLGSLPESPELFGLVHSDFHHGNFFVDGDRLTLFDFDDTCFHWFAHDLAVAVYHLPLNPDQARHDENVGQFLRALLRGYRRVARIEPSGLENLPLFMKWRDVVIYGFFHKALAIDSLPLRMRDHFAGMRKRIEADRPIADVSGAE